MKYIHERSKPSSSCQRAHRLSVNNINAQASEASQPRSTRQDRQRTNWEHFTTTLISTHLLPSDILLLLSLPALLLLLLVVEGLARRFNLIGRLGNCVNVRNKQQESEYRPRPVALNGPLCIDIHRGRVTPYIVLVTSRHTVFVVQRVTLAEALLNFNKVQRHARADLRHLDGRLLHTTHTPCA